MYYFVSLHQASTKNIYQPHRIKHPAKKVNHSHACTKHKERSTFNCTEVILPFKEESKGIILWGGGGEWITFRHQSENLYGLLW